MSFLRRLFAKPERIAEPTAEPNRRAAVGPITDWSDDAIDRTTHRVAIFDPMGRTIRVVGVSEYQGTLEVIAGGRTTDGARDRDHLAALFPEPHNVYDRNAVRVVLSQQVERPKSAHVGYLSRADALAYRPIIDRLAAGGFVACCRASIGGGWERGDDQGSFGVRLHIDTPQNLMREIDESEWAAQVPPREDYPLAASWSSDGDERLGMLLAGLQPTTGEFAGQTICFTGPSVCTVGGRRLSRADQERLAATVGLRTHPRVTKAVDVLVQADVSTRSGKVSAAAEYATRIVAERDFWPAVGVPLDD